MHVLLGADFVNEKTAASVLLDTHSDRNCSSHYPVNIISVYTDPESGVFLSSELLNSFKIVFSFMTCSCVVWYV